MKRKIEITYYWECEGLDEIPLALAEALEESAQERIASMVREGYTSGELCDNVNMDLVDKETPEDGWECSGGWTFTMTIPED